MEEGIEVLCDMRMEGLIGVEVEIVEERRVVDRVKEGFGEDLMGLGEGYGFG